MSGRDWARTLVCAEIDFANDVFGAGVASETVTALATPTAFDCCARSSGSSWAPSTGSSAPDVTNFKIGLRQKT
jgi:hypothetical protein